jgi:hypothetical protein
VLQHRRTPGRHEVGLLVRDEPPVGDVADGGEQHPVQGGELVAPHHRCRGHGGQDERERRQQPPGAAAVEADHVDAPGAPELVDEQPGDEVAADHEEQVDAEEAARQRRRGEVVDDDGRHRQGPQPVQAAKAPPGAGPRRRRTD